MVGREVTKSSDEVRAALDKESAPAAAADGAAAGDVAASPGTERGGEGGSFDDEKRKEKCFSLSPLMSSRRPMHHTGYSTDPHQSYIDLYLLCPQEYHRFRLTVSSYPAVIGCQSLF